MKYTIISLLIIVGCFSQSIAQNNTCATAKVLCGTNSETNVPTTNFEFNVPNTGLSCSILAYRPTLWYQVNITKSGTFTFILTSNPQIDYDWAVWINPDCNNIQNTPSDRLSFDGQFIPTGITTIGTLTDDGGGCPANPTPSILSPLSVLAGDRVIIAVNYFSGAASPPPFTLKVCGPDGGGGTAEFDCFCCKEELVYSTSKQGYNRSLPVISASNAQHREVDFCSFEENNFDLSKVATTEDLYDGLMPKLNTTFLNTDKSSSHTGTYSLKLNQNANYTYDFKVCANDNPNYQYIFNLDKEKDYRIQFWVKLSDYVSYTSPNIFEIFYYDNTNMLISSTGTTGIIRTEKVEGWQLYELIFKLPTNTDKVSFKFKGSTTNNVLRYFDDVKISPTSSSSKTYVYDEKSLKLIGELDENHFTTFYDYDEDGNLIRLRKETEKGIVTIKEMNINFQKGN